MSTNPEEASQQGRLAQETSGTYPSSQEAEDASGCSHRKDANPMVILRLAGVPFLGGPLVTTSPVMVISVLGFDSV